MATSLAHDANHDDWAEPRPTPVDQAQWLMLTLLSLASVALLGAFLLFVIDDYVIRNVIALN
jgi:hypothetical protein